MYMVTKRIEKRMNTLYYFQTSSASKILAAKKADTGAWEAEIDFLVYKLYGLSYDEVLIVDPRTPISKEDYEKAQ